MAEKQKMLQRGSPPPVPRWTKIFVIVFILLLLLVFVLHLIGFGFGGHGASGVMPDSIVCSGMFQGQVARYV